MTARTPAPNLAGLVDWLDRDPSHELAALYEQATGRVANDPAVRRCGLAVMRLVVPSWRPRQRLTNTQAEGVGRVYSHLIGDTRGDQPGGPGGGRYVRVDVRRPQSRAALLTRLRYSLREVA